MGREPGVGEPRARKDDFSRHLRIAAKEEVLITRHSRPAGVLIGFESEDDWFEYRLEHDRTFLARIVEARAELRRGEGMSWRRSKRRAV